MVLSLCVVAKCRRRAFAENPDVLDERRQLALIGQGRLPRLEPLRAVLALLLRLCRVPSPSDRRARAPRKAQASNAWVSGISVKSRTHVTVYAPAVDEPVVVKVVPDEPEAQVVCGLLRSAGIECGYRDTEAIESSLEDFTAAGPREILVHQSDLETARALLGAGEG
jgi:hypothetical protein